MQLTARKNELHRKMDGVFIQVARFLPRSRVNGPGLRSVLWVQGCPLRCPGCFNPQFLEFRGGGVHSAAEVLEWILREETEGVTFSGGEPFAHASGLGPLAESLQIRGKSVVIFSGFKKAALETSTDPHRKKLYRNADLILAGPYMREKPFRHALLSSANQEMVFVSNRYRFHDFGPRHKKVEIHIGIHGETGVTGFPRQAGLGMEKTGGLG